MSEQIINSRQSLEAYKKYLDAQFEKDKYLRATLKTGKQRSLTQNASLHLFCQMLADALNDAGLDMQKVLSQGTSIPWSAEKVKEDIWRKVQQAALGKKSTVKLERTEVSVIYDIINRHISTSFGIFVPFPCKDDL